MTQKRTVAVSIQGREYRIRADRDEASIQRAAELLDETMSKVRARSGTADSVDIAVLAALNLASTVTESRGVGSSGQEQRIEELARLVATALQDHGPAPT